MLPATMRFVDLPEYGGASVMCLKDGPLPVCDAQELLIEVHAAGVNRPDIVQRQGRYPPPPGASPVMGLEVAGRVVAVGESVSGWCEGDEVCALCNGGGYAEYVAVPASQCLPKPASLSLTEAASLPETLFTVWSTVFVRAGLQAGESFLVHGGSSGIGVTAIQLARAMGATVYATAGSAEKCETCETLGADLAVNYREQDFVAAIMEHSENRGVDVILDMVGGDYVEKNLQVAALGGRIVSIAFLRGPKTELNLLPLMLKRLTMTGATLRPQSSEAKAGYAHALQEKIWPLIEQGKLQAQIDSVYPIDAIVQAHERMESNQHIGKIVVKLRD